MTPRRLRRIFRADGRTLIVALDHGLIAGPVRGLETPGALLAHLGAADAVLASYGLAVRFAAQLIGLGLILRLDGGGTGLGTMTGPGAQFYTVEDALCLGAEAVAVSAFPGAADEAASLERLARVVSEAHAWGLPVMAEMSPGGFDSGPAFRTAENVALAARVAAELGADWVKVPYIPDFAQVTAHCYVPVVILGGAKGASEEQTLETVKASLKAGGAGGAMGRNIFQADQPERMTAALAQLIHGAAAIP